ncbi:MAG: hypothetical protein CXZ00_00035 [Acidobacteria bacterium]|nr:MAG: hypothetical protein CXZ00_00035 [Acidobacteriota bacterium]
MDLSSARLRAFHFASEIAARCEASLLIIDIVPKEEKLLSEYRHMMDDLEEEIGMSFSQAGGGETRDIRRNVLIRHGSIGSSLAKGAAQQNVDLIVLGTHGWIGLKSSTKAQRRKKSRIASCQEQSCVKQVNGRGHDYEPIIGREDEEATRSQI